MNKISVSGKGGTGKSVTITLLAGVLLEKGFTVLVIDSDESNPGLYRMLGFDKAPKPLMELFGGERKVTEALSRMSRSEEADPLVKSLVSGELKLKDIPHEYVLKKDGLRLLSIGKITAALQGCACPIGMLCKIFLEKLALQDNEIAVVDMEAGVEHFGRGIEQAIDTVIAVVEPSFESIVLASKINFLAYGSGVKNVWAVLNKIPSDIVENKLKDEVIKRGVKVLGSIRYDAKVSEACLEGKSLGESGARDDMRKLVSSLLNQKTNQG